VGGARIHSDPLEGLSIQWWSFPSAREGTEKDEDLHNEQQKWIVALVIIANALSVVSDESMSAEAGGMSDTSSDRKPELNQERNLLTFCTAVELFKELIISTRAVSIIALGTPSSFLIFSVWNCAKSKPSTPSQIFFVSRSIALPGRIISESEPVFISVNQLIAFRSSIALCEHVEVWKLEHRHHRQRLEAPLRNLHGSTMNCASMQKTTRRLEPFTSGRSRSCVSKA
jgi:hypothetical protein